MKLLPLILLRAVHVLIVLLSFIIICPTLCVSLAICRVDTRKTVTQQHKP
jgi:hypothetical protein